MKPELAERLLVKVMGWSAPEISRERPRLQAIAYYKYDEYQQFSPGMRFIESLAYWLEQFSREERRIAYDFVMESVLFCSAAEMFHYISTAYPDFIRPRLLKSLTAGRSLPTWCFPKLINDPAFKVLLRSTLFLGLSDGSRTDLFRRLNPELSQEQVRLSHEITDPRAAGLLKKLRGDLEKLSVTDFQKQKFKRLVLLDDFSASGISYLRKEGTEFDGKIYAFCKGLFEEGTPVSKLFDLESLEITVLLYMGTQKSFTHITDLMEEVFKAKSIRYDVIFVHLLNDSCRIPPACDKPIAKLIESYYDAEIEDEHTRKGGKNVKYGFADCGLPLVLSHNTPNNTIPLLWANTAKVRPLFPRVSRHRK